MFEGLRELLRDYRGTLEYDRRVLLEEFELWTSRARWWGSGASGPARRSHC